MIEKSVVEIEKQSLYALRPHNKSKIKLLTRIKQEIPFGKVPKNRIFCVGYVQKRNECMNRHPQILDRRQTALLIVDVQQRINSVVMNGTGVVENIVKLIETCKIYHLPIFITEQYPKGLGPTEPKILEALESNSPLQKMTFSCCGSGELIEQIRAKGIKQLIVAGIEAHVCVQQTALDLLAQDFQVHVPKDAVSSRKELDYQTALERMARAGIVLTTIETALFELMAEAGTPEFKKVSKLIK